jgi:4-amino-4-deoxy-L-arabinose transferase-like glycosyltransferase
VDPEFRDKPALDWVTTAACLFVLGAICIQLRIGWLLWGSDLTGSDPPAHFTTGVMVYEYFRQALFSQPMAFAQSFYIRFPKVALGHWPPMYYALQAAVYTVSGPSIKAARALSAAVCFATAYVLFARVRRLHGMTLGALCAACFLVLPPVQDSSWLVMSDLLLALFMFLAAMSFADFLESGEPCYAVRFALWSTLAILTKGSGGALGLFALFAPLFARRFFCFRSKWYWFAGISVAILSAPFYLWTQSIHIGYAAETADLVKGAFNITLRFNVLSAFTGFLPPFVFLIALAGAAFAWHKRPSPSEAAAMALILSQVTFQLILPLTAQGRYFMPSAAAIILLFARGLTLSGRRLGPLALVAGCFAASGFPRVQRVDGYWAAVDSIPYRAQGDTILVSSDATGEGAFVAERLEHDRARGGVVIRGSKVLGNSSWAGTHYRLIFQNPVEVSHYLQSVPVRYIVIDRSAVPEPHQKLLEEAVRSAPEVFPLTGRFLVSGARYGEILVFENLRAVGRSPIVHTKIGSWIVEYKMK